MSQFRGANGSFLTQALFYEFGNEDAPYTLRNSEELYWTNRKGKKYKSVPYIYRHSVDEYDAAMQILGSWEHWQYLLRINKWFLNGKFNTEGVQVGMSVKDMREEMEARDRSRSKRILQEQAEEGNVTAARFLYEQSTKGAKAVGRPEKKKPEKSASKVSNIYEEIKKRNNV